MKLSDVLHHIKNAEESFALTWVTCDRTRKTGGEIRTLDGLRLGKGEKETLSKKLLRQQEQQEQGRRRNYAQDTMNLYHPDTGKHVRVHKRLILKLNQHNVIY